MLNSNSSTAKKKSETCEEQLRRMCKNIADGITSPEEITDEGNRREAYRDSWRLDGGRIRHTLHRGP
jgi:hypothetical protein